MASRLMGAVAGWEKANTAGDGERREYLSVQARKMGEERLWWCRQGRRIGTHRPMSSCSCLSPTTAAMRASPTTTLRSMLGITDS